MVQKTRLATLLGLSGALLVSGVAHAQSYPGGSPSGKPAGYGAPSSMSAPMGAPGNTTASAPGAVNNQTVDSSSTITSSTTDTSVAGATDESTLEPTGGEPWMMAFAGLALAAGALTLRRRIN